MFTYNDQRPLGRTGLSVSALGLAAFSMATFTDFKRSALTARDVERAYYELGINTFLVHFLMPDVIKGVRQLIRNGERDRLVLVSEVGLSMAGSVQRGLHYHLRLLGTDHLDVWLFGWVRSARQLRESVWERMRQLRESGKTRAIGYSSHDRPLAAGLAQALDPDVLMIRYNAAHRGAEREVFATLPQQRELRPGVIAYTATRWGMLLDPLPERGYATGMTAPECYRFALGNPAVDVAWCAAGNFEQLQQDVAGVAEGPLSPERLTEVCAFGNVVHETAKGGKRWMFGRQPN